MPILEELHVSATISYYSNPKAKFGDICIKDFNDNKRFWKKLKSFFSDKDLTNSNIILKKRQFNH